MSYKALYRKWRPIIFEDIVGQQHIITTLKNQISTRNISHAYLFAGTRGTGKTSTAKIFARAVNCLSPVDENPCNECENCTGIITESVMDVIEIDAASNNGVDHIREIRENVKYPPSKGKYKVYIVDEVHMLSTGAFNALLKTLEEPPKHVIFILATTEPQKLPATILSRCQRFDFKPVSIKDIKERLTNICDAEKISYDDKGLQIIAANGRGSLRDSLSILEQCISFTQGDISYEKVVEALGIVGDEFLVGLVEAITEKKTSEALKQLQKVIIEGKDILLLVKELISYLRKLLLTQIEVETEELSIDSREKHRVMEEQGRKLTEKYIIEMIYKLSDIEAKIRYSTQPQIIVEVAIVDMCNQRPDININEMLERIEKLEKLVLKGEFNTNSKEINSIKSKELKTIKEENEETYEVQKEKGNNEEESSYIKREMDTKDNTSADILKTCLTADFSIIKDKWQDVLEKLRQNKKAQIKAFLMEGNLHTIRGNELIISFKEGYGFHREALDKDKSKDYLIETIKQVTGQEVKLSFVMENESAHEEKQQDASLEKLKQVVPNGILQVIEE
ncbi:DNA polymerase III subunit gamma/tau [Alkaliphilus pronyensis]|uniref:DNA-directed DNA polymerase n=1 Tax=Alkaliphilus pronyensis TaxID=1482732 RepID=A0A6I0F535_9FIRM|nr:DNA polymerase III subunit gamma/tau [Alkaliphilus pronyensis]KAB3530296.1 DNA polymerase III subunit gamma/tau [Alkaliphilus pronyensis]